MQLFDDLPHIARGRGSFDRMNRIYRIISAFDTACRHPVDPVKSSDECGRHSISNAWSSSCLPGEFPTAAYLGDAHTTLRVEG